MPFKYLEPDKASDLLYYTSGLHVERDHPRGQPHIPVRPGDPRSLPPTRIRSSRGLTGVALRLGLIQEAVRTTYTPTDSECHNSDYTSLTTYSSVGELTQCWSPRRIMTVTRPALLAP
jgi:hypothetical protein